MNDKLLYILLDVIIKNGDARRLTAEGLDYKAIGELTHSALQGGLLTVDEKKKLILTPKGVAKYQADSKKFKKTDKSLWIQPQTKSKTSKIDRNAIFLPDKNELSF